MIFFYNLLFVFVIGLIFKHKLSNPRYKKIYLIICFFQMALIQGFRFYDVGTDTSSYVSVFDNYQTSKYYGYLFTHYEIGFQLLYEILKHFKASYTILLCVISLIMMFGFGLFIYNNSVDVRFSVFLFACMFYPNSFNIMRQYLALSIAINSYTFYKNDHILKALIIILISSFFHSTSLLLMIPLILFKIKHWKLIRNSILVFSILLFMFSDSIIPNILNLLEKSYYISRYDVSQIFRLTTFLTMLFSLFFWYILHHKKSFLFNDYINHFTCIVYCNFAFGLLYLKYEYFSRLIELYNIFLLISMPFGIYIMKSYYRPLLKIAAYIIPIFIMINSVFNSGSGVENYRMFFMIM